MRLIVGIALFYRAVETLHNSPTMRVGVVCVLAIIAGVLLVMGLRTSIAGFVLAVAEVWRAVAQPSDLWAHILLATLAAAVAMIGPGAWSFDAYLSGWKRIDVPPRKG